MGPRILLSFCLLTFSLSAWAEPAKPPETTPTGLESVTDYKVVREKKLTNYKVEIQQRMTTGKYPRVESMKARIIPNDGGSVTHYTGTWLSPDPRGFVIAWKGGLLDLDGDGIEDLLLQNYSGGGHCCYNYVIYSLSKPLQKMGDLPMKDCGEKISLEDLNGDKKMELLSCNPDFAYLGDQPYSESPFPPAIYSLKSGVYQRADGEFRQVFMADIQAQREALAKGYRPANALQIVTDYLLLGEDAQAWQEFDTLYQGADKEKIRQQLLVRMGKAPAPPPATPKPLGSPQAPSPAAPAGPGPLPW